MSHNITVKGGTSVRLPTAGKYCDRDIIVTAEGGGIALDVITASALPDAVVDGQIVVITDTTPGAVYIDTDEPESPAAGDVWVKLEAEATARLELSEESPYLRGGLTETSQWNGSEWVPLSGYMGVAGEWKKFSEPLPPIGTALNDMLWETIAKISASGKAAEYFLIGDKKKIVINGAVGKTLFDNYSIEVQIIGIDHNADVEGSNTIHFQIGNNGTTALCLTDSNYNSTVSVEGYFNMNYSVSNAGGWETSKMRVVLLGNSNPPSSPLAGSMIAALPSDLRAVMKGVTKYSNNKGGANVTDSDVTATTDYLWLLSEYEVNGTSTYAYSGEASYQKRYDYYASGNSKIRYIHTDTTTAAYWWLRSPYSGNSNNFCRVDASGTMRTANSHVSIGVSPCFCV